MSKSINNPNKFATNDEPESGAFDPSGLTDDTDFPHTGLFKALNLGVQGNYVVNGFNISAATATGLTVAAGKVMKDGQLVSVNGASLTLSTTHTNGYHLLVAPIKSDEDSDGSTPDTSTVVLRNPTAANKVPDYTAGDTIIAIVAYVGSTGPLQVQYLTNNKTENSLSIGRDNSGYTEGLTIQSNAGDIEIEALEQDKDIIFKVNDGGASTEAMRIDGATANLGIGTNAPTEKLHLSDADGTEPTILIENTGTNASEPELVFLRSTGTGADSRDIGNIKFKAKDTAGNLHTFAQIMADSLDADTTTEDGRMVFTLTQAGTDHVEFFSMGNLESVFNNGANDINFRVEGSSDANLLFVDAGNDRVGIGTNAPDTELHVVGAANPTITIQETGQTGHLKLTGLQDSQAQIIAENESAGETAILELDVKAVNGQDQSVRMHRNSNANSDAYLVLKQPGTNTNSFLFYSDKDGTAHKAVFSGELELDGALNHDGTTAGFFGATPTTKITVGNISAPAAINPDVPSSPSAAEITSTQAAITALENKLDAVIDALQALGLIA